MKARNFADMLEDLGNAVIAAGMAALLVAALFTSPGCKSFSLSGLSFENGEGNKLKVDEAGGEGE